MPSRRLFVAALLVAGLALAAIEESHVLAEDGGLLETHCNACLLQLGTRGVTTEAFSLPQAVANEERVVVVLLPTLPEAAPRPVPSRGPPPA